MEPCLVNGDTARVVLSGGPADGLELLAPVALPPFIYAAVPGAQVALTASDCEPSVARYRMSAAVRRDTCAGTPQRVVYRYEPEARSDGSD